jgi:hypothetical protein
MDPNAAKPRTTSRREKAHDVVHHHEWKVVLPKGSTAQQATQLGQAMRTAVRATGDYGTSTPTFSRAEMGQFAFGN